MGDVQQFGSGNQNNAIINILTKLAESSGVAITSSLIVKNFSALVYLLEKNATSWYQQQKYEREVYSKFRDVLFALKQINNSTSNSSYNFCMRMYQLDTNQEKIEFMHTVASSFQNDFMETMEGTAKLEIDFCKSKLGSYLK